jgi:hypothetical protein
MRMAVGEQSSLQVSQKNGRDLDPDHRMWLEYMRQRRAKGAGYMHPEMKEEMERVDRELAQQQSAIDNSPMYAPGAVGLPCTCCDAPGQHVVSPHVGPGSMHSRLCVW